MIDSILQYVQTPPRSFAPHRPKPQPRHRFQQPQHNTRRQDRRRPQEQPKRRPQDPRNSGRRNRKLPPPSSNNNIQQFRGKFVQRPQKPTPSPFPFNPFPSLNPFSFFESSEKKQVGFTKRPVPQRQPDYLENFNAIQTIPAPDLTKFGPPIIELDTKEIHQ